jgi:hypothetical protein
VVNASTTQRACSRLKRVLLRAPILFAGLVLFPTAALCGGAPPFSPLGTRPLNPALPGTYGGNSLSPQALSQMQIYDPAAAQLYALWSFGAMSVIAPLTYGDFISPSALTSNFGFSTSTPMSPMQGVDPSVAADLNNLFEGNLMPSGGAGGGGGGGDGGDASGSTTVAASGSGVNAAGAVVQSPGGSVIALPGPLSAVTTAPGILPSCAANGQEQRLQAGSEFWTGQASSASPVQFARGLFSGSTGGNPLGDLGPAGDPSNVVSQGPVGAWCLPQRLPFSQSSPLESRLTWIAIAIVIFSVLAFFLSRGFQRPTLDADSLVVNRSGTKPRLLRQA